MAQSGPSDRIAINGRSGEVMWRHADRPIERLIKTVDRHLSEGVRGGFLLDEDSHFKAFNLSRLSREL